MGLDSVELVMAIEEEFGLEIPDKAAERMYTVGDVYTYIKDRIATAQPGACLTQRTFYKIRKTLIEHFGIERQSVDLNTRLGDLISKQELEEAWPFLGLMIGENPPPFERVRSSWFTESKESADQYTVRDLVEEFVRANANESAKEKDEEQEIWRRLVDVFVRQVNVTRAEVVPEASITRSFC
jgi:acyl carrier protein